jgi:hypothetical protein
MACYRDSFTFIFTVLKIFSGVLRQVPMKSFIYPTCLLTDVSRLRFGRTTRHKSTDFRTLYHTSSVFTPLHYTSVTCNNGEWGGFGAGARGGRLLAEYLSSVWMRKSRPANNSVDVSYDVCGIQ